MAARPDEAVSFYSARALVPEAHARGESWADQPARSWLNAQAVALPHALADLFVSWEGRQPAEVTAPWKKSYDMRLSAFLAHLGRKVCLTVPSLVDHAQVPSVMGHPKSTGGRPRVAALFQAHDTRYIDWTRTGSTTKKAGST